MGITCTEINFRNIQVTFKELNDDIEWTYLNIFKHELDEVKAIIIIFDVTNENSFNTAKNLINYVQLKTSIFINIFLLGNKCDLILNSIITIKDVFEFIRGKECVFYKEISCKDETNLEALFTYLEESLTYNCIPKLTSASGDGDNNSNSYSCNLL